MKRVLVYHSYFSSWNGGGGLLPLSLIAELQKTCEVTLALRDLSNVDVMAKMNGIPIDFSKLKLVRVMPEKRFLRDIDHNLRVFRTWKLKRLAKDADVCISTANPVDFGKPGHHFIVFMNFWDSAFSDYLKHIPPPKGIASFKRKIRSLLAEKILRPFLGIRTTRKLLSDPREHTYPNSQYVDSVMRGFYGPFTGTVFYPPTTFEVKLKDVKRNPLQVNYVGRISKEKRIEDIISIVELARTSSGLDLTLHIAGQMEDTPYAERIKQIAMGKSWIRLVGHVYGEEKERFLLSGTYAVHTRRDEEFGIAITEYLKAGCVPIIPDEGGPVEILESPALAYHTNEDAATILVKLLQDEAFRKTQLAHCAERAKAFTMDAYLENQHRILEKILSETA